MACCCCDPKVAAPAGGGALLLGIGAFLLVEKVVHLVDEWWQSYCIHIWPTVFTVIVDTFWALVSLAGLLIIGGLVRFGLFLRRRLRRYRGTGGLVLHVVSVIGLTESAAGDALEGLPVTHPAIEAGIPGNFAEFLNLTDGALLHEPSAVERDGYHQ